jgi:hypothetical protein
MHSRVARARSSPGLGFDAKTWDLLRSTDWKIGGEEYFSPQIVDKLDDAAI